MSATAAPVSTLAGRIAEVRSRVEAACERASRDPSGVTLIGVSKTWPVADLLAATEAGLRDFGENYAQEGVPKLEALRALTAAPVRGHFIGSLQRNKVKAVLASFAIIHSVDSERLLEAIAADGRAVGVFLQVNLAGETSKGGISAMDVGGLVAAARSLAHVPLLGLMTVPPATPAEETRPWFRQLRELAHEHGLAGLSMGMTGDFEVAIEEGATHVRVGQAIFGARP